MLYFSGHGLELNGENYLIPVDANITVKSDTEFEATALRKITTRMQGIANKLNIVVLDACRNDPFAKALGIGGLAQTQPPVGLLVSYATGAGKVASDGRLGENGLFTKYLVENMQKPLTLQEVFRETRHSVALASNQKQRPAIYDETTNSDFYFTIPTLEIKSVNLGKNWKEANSYCQNFQEKNFNWKLPTVEELLLLSNIKFDYIHNNSKSWKAWFQNNKNRRNKLREGEVFLKNEYLSAMNIGNSFWADESKTIVNFEKGIIQPNYMDKSNFICISK